MSDGNPLPETGAPAPGTLRSRGTFTPARHAMFGLTLASFGNYCLLSLGLLLLLLGKIRVSAAAHFLMLAMGIGAFPLVTACSFYFKDGKKRFTSPVWRWYSGIIGVVVVMLTFQILNVRPVPFAVRGIAALGMLWFTCAVLLPLPQFVERLLARDWKSVAAALWCVGVMVLLLGGVISCEGAFPRSEAAVAAGAGLWLTGYLARACWYARLEGLPFRKAFHYFCWPLWIGTVLAYVGNLWIALPKYESGIPLARAAVEKKFGHPVDRKVLESAWYGGGVRADEHLKAYEQEASSEAFRKTLFFRASCEAAPDLSRENGMRLRQETGKDGAAAPVLKAEEVILAELPIRQTLDPDLLISGKTSHLTDLLEISRHRLLLGKLALRAKKIPDALRHLAELEALAESAASEPMMISRMVAFSIGKRALELGEECWRADGISAGEKREVAKVAESANRLFRSFAKSARFCWYGEAVIFDELMTAVRNGNCQYPLLRPYGMRYVLPQLAVVAAKGHRDGLRHFAEFPHPPVANPAEFLWRQLVPDFSAARTELLNFRDRVRALK